MGFHKGGAEEDVADWFVNLVADPSKTLTRCALVPIRPRSRGERRFLRTFPGVYLRPAIAFNPRPRCLSNPPDAFQLHQGEQSRRESARERADDDGRARERVEGVQVADARGVDRDDGDPRGRGADVRLRESAVRRVVPAIADDALQERPGAPGDGDGAE
eukprot:31379-Pelagococcus_subviridis.AAC.38